MPDKQREPRYFTVHSTYTGQGCAHCGKLVSGHGPKLECLSSEAAAPAQPVPPNECTCGDIYAGYPPNTEPGSDTLDSTCPIHGTAAPTPVLTPTTSQRLPEGDIASDGTSGVKVDGRLTEAVLTQPSAESKEFFRSDKPFDNEICPEDQFPQEAERTLLDEAKRFGMAYFAQLMLEQRAEHPVLPVPPEIKAKLQLAKKQMRAIDDAQENTRALLVNIDLFRYLLARASSPAVAPQGKWAVATAKVHSCGHTEAQHLYHEAKEFILSPCEIVSKSVNSQSGGSASGLRPLREAVVLHLRSHLPTMAAERAVFAVRAAFNNWDELNAAAPTVAGRTQGDEDAERIKFEAHEVTAGYLVLGVIPRREEDGMYASNSRQQRWLGWRARAALRESAQPDSSELLKYRGRLIKLSFLLTGNDAAFLSENPQIDEALKGYAENVLEDANESAGEAEQEIKPHSSVIHTDLKVRCSICQRDCMWHYLEDEDTIQFLFHDCGREAASEAPDVSKEK